MPIIDECIHHPLFSGRENICNYWISSQFSAFEKIVSVLLCTSDNDLLPTHLLYCSMEDVFLKRIFFGRKIVIFLFACIITCVKWWPNHVSCTQTIWNGTIKKYKPLCFQCQLILLVFASTVRREDKYRKLHYERFDFEFI